MKVVLQKNHRLLFFGLWLLLGLIQSGLTEMQDDEAYYWVYSRYLDWGYFDHPPMIAVLIKLGYAIFPNELGVRLFPLLLNVFSLFIIEKLLEKKNPFLFYTIALSIVVLQLSGFVAVPDIPLIFFTALFFLCYRNFIAKTSWLNTFLLATCIALLLYSKYHAALIILFTLLSNIKLLKNYKVYVAGIVALLLFTPHLWWQYQHDWVSIRYHLFESNVNAYRLAFTTDYILGQLLLAGPLAGIVLLPAAFLYKPKNEMEKALRYTMVGIYACFFVSSFRGQVEANWTAPAIVPLIILSHQYLNEKLKWQKILYKLLPLTLVLVLFARICMLVDILPFRVVKIHYHAWKEWPKEMKERTKGLPIVFSNSYQRASKYWFYTGQMTLSQNWDRERRNNYNFWPIEDSILGKPVYFLDIHRVSRFPDSLKTAIGWIGYRYDSSFISFFKVSFGTSSKKYRLKEKQPLTMTCNLKLSDQYESFIRNHQFSDTIKIDFFNKKGWVKEVITNLSLHNLIDHKIFNITIDPELPKGEYFFRFSIKNSFYNATHNSDKIGLVIE